jgi:hypothetical protein
VQDFAQQHRLQHLPLGTQAAIFIGNAPGIATSTRATYANSMRSLTNRLGGGSSLLALLSSALTASGASGTPTDAELRQAKPVERAQVEEIVKFFVEEQQQHLAMAAWIMWKTASRFDDVRLLTPAALIHREPARCILQWKRWKTNRAERRFVHSWTVVDELQHPEMLQLLYEVADATPQDASMVGAMTTSTFIRRLQRVPGCEELTAHSFKRGAARFLFKMAAEGRVSSDDVRLIPMLLKHRDHLHDMPSSTLGYVANVADLAVTLRTQHLTRLL